MRKIPVQARAKERVERILDATEALIIEDGVAKLAVADIATRAGVPIGSLYQYFTNRDEVLRALCARYYQTLEAAAADCFSNVRSINDFITDVRTALQLCWRFTQENAGYRRLFFDVQAWEVLREADWDDTLLNAERMQRCLAPLLPQNPPERVLALCILIGDTASGTARLAARFDHLRSELFAELIAMVESRVYAMLVTGSQRRLEAIQ
jgi:AcrR family transcriptional regulator